MEKFEIAKSKILRGDIIKNLYTLYGEKAAISALRNLMRYKSYNSDKDIKRALDYLLGVGYIEIVLDEGNYWSSLLELTPIGVNLAEGDITDLGVVFNE